MKIFRLAFALLLILQSFSLLAQKTRVIKMSGHIDSADIFKLCYVSVNIPAGITEIKVEEKYSNEGKNVLNLGVFGPQGYDLGNAAGFRGWSGGAKTSFFINEEEASTGYIPGNIYKGTWNILIYPSSIIKEGIDWTLEVELVSGQHKRPFKMVTANEQINNKAGWYKGDLHMHTLHSDGKRTQQELTDEASSKRLDYIISTEHNTNSANLMWGKYEKKDLLIINGEEVTTTTYGHWNAIGLKPQSWIEWRYNPKDNVIKKYIDQVHNNGGLCIINHPFYTKNLTNGFGFDPNLFDGIEIWNGNWDILDALALKWWDSILKTGKRMLAIGASDTHKSSGSPNNLGTPQTVVYAPSLSQKGILQGLKSGKAYITIVPDLKFSMTAKCRNKVAGIGDELTVISDEQVTLNLSVSPLPNSVISIIGSQGVVKSVKATEQNQEWLIDAENLSYIRLEIKNEEGQLLVMTNPIWIIRNNK
ncbi:CehA/McbA family metallohydrolase [Mucilaginibacter terrae]|uniref:CehA/McbA family metallohydrolase n=1 Tax=Mucilaginibacter terrae TaxID=1955052 RepID=UPI0036260DE0